MIGLDIELMNGMKARLWLELAVLFGALPAIVAVLATGRPVLPALWLMAAGCLVALIRDRSFDLRKLWSRGQLKQVLAPILVRFALFTATACALVAAMKPALFFNLPRIRPGLWALIMILYPILSVWPQGIVYRAFFMHRYRPLFKAPAALVAASAIAFAWTHIVFWNWLALGLALAGGWLFARTYQRAGSLPASMLEHSLYGCFIFTVGLGHYFFHSAATLAWTTPSF